MAGKGLDTSQLLFFLAAIALVVGIVFHVIYLVSDRSSDSPQDLYNRENAKMFFLMAASLALVAWLWMQMPRREM